MGYLGNIDEMTTVGEKNLTISTLVSHKANPISYSINW